MDGFDSVLTWLRKAGPVGEFFINVLMSSVLPLVLAVTAIYLVIAGQKEQEGLPSSPPASIDNSASQTQSTGAVTQQVFVGGKPAELQEEKRKNQEEELPVVSYIQARVIHLGENPNGIWVEVDGLPPNGIVAQFKNILKDVGQRTPRADSAKANLVFRNPARIDEQEIHVSHGTWLRHYEHFATFNAGGTHDLVVALREDSFITLENPNTSNPFNERHLSRSGGVIHHARKIALPWDDGELVVTLVDTGGPYYFQWCIQL